MSQNLTQVNQLVRVRTEYCIRVFHAWLRRQMHKIREANRIRRDHDHLLELSDEMLEDIGLTRFDIDKGCARPVRSTFGGLGMHLW